MIDLEDSHHTASIRPKIMTTDSTATYHHGNLRAELLQTAARTLQQMGVDKFSMRAISRDLGVSQSAPFRHFKDKNELLVALAIGGFQRLTQAQQQAKEGLQPPDTLIATGIAYVDFACNNPELFKLMFGSHIENRGPDHFPELCAAGDEAYAELYLTIQQGIDQASFRNRPVEKVAFAAWSMVHGLASLSLEGTATNIPTEAKHALIRSSLEIFLHGVGN